jgi:CheY-like chemotaxis protein
MDGVHAIQYLKTDPQTARIPVCAISAYEADGEPAEDELSRSWDCFLTKPITPHELIAEIESTIGPPHPEPPLP